MRRAALLLAIVAGCAGPAHETEPPEEPKAEAAPAPEPPAEPAPPTPPAEPRPPPAAAAPQRAMGRFDPPATLGHLETTPPEQRKEIDGLVAVLLDPTAGRDSLEAKTRLAEIGKPAFLPILGKMAAIRDTISDVDSMEERLVESALMLADQCLRQMDGYLDTKGKAWIRPGTDWKYIKYILALHYRRWCDGLGSTPLKDLDAMPGPFAPDAD